MNMLRVLPIFLLGSFSILAGDLSGRYEVSAFGGTTNRIPTSSGADGNFGGNFGYGINSKTTAFAEFTSNAGGYDYLDVHAGLKRTLVAHGKIEPYVLGGLGMARMTGFSVGHTSSFSVNAGFGARLYVNRHWGVQPEFRWMHAFQPFKDVNLLRTTGGIFFQWGGE